MLIRLNLALFTLGQLILKEWCKVYLYLLLYSRPLSMIWFTFAHYVFVFIKFTIWGQNMVDSHDSDISRKSNILITLHHFKYLINTFYFFFFLLYHKSYHIYIFFSLFSSSLMVLNNTMSECNIFLQEKRDDLKWCRVPHQFGSKFNVGAVEYFTDEWVGSMEIRHKFHGVKSMRFKFNLVLLLVLLFDTTYSFLC